MKLTVVTNFNSTIVYENVSDIKYVERTGMLKEISFYSLSQDGSIQWNWQYLDDIKSIVLTSE